MTGEQLRKALERLGTTQVQFAKAIGHNDRTVRFWISGRYKVPKDISLLVNLLLECKVSEED